MVTDLKTIDSKDINYPQNWATDLKQFVLKMTVNYLL